MLIHWIWYATREGMNDREKAMLLQYFRDPEEIFYADAVTFSGIECMTPGIAQALKDKDLTPSQRIMEQCERKGLRILTYRDAAYPARLRSITDPPMVLYYKGHLPDFDSNPVIGVVGTRKASAYGLTAAKRMGYQIGKCGGIVVSGMAFGIDGLAMQGALTAGQTVVGVLGCGADMVYPLSNRALFADVERHGCIISEFPPETPPYKWNFPRRNRIISGLSNGVLVVEAPQISGALITARQASDQGRDVFAVPGNIDVPTCAGSNELLRDGAILASTGWDVVREYVHLYPGKIRKDTAPVHQRAYADEVMRSGAEGDESAPKVAQKPKTPRHSRNPAGKKDKKPIDKETNSSYSDVNEPRADLTPAEQTITDLIGDREWLVDDIIAEAGMPAPQVLAALTMLEVKGVVKTLPGRRVAGKQRK